MAVLDRETRHWPVGRYNVILADPPWPYDDRCRHRGGAVRHYPVMTPEEMGALPVWVLAADRAVLFLWATGPNLPMALETMAQWGFRYRCVAFTWLKSNADNTLFLGMGHYTRSNAEFCLLGVRGKSLPRLCKAVPMAQIHARGKHSAKPGAFRREIERLYGAVPRVELFAREYAAGWDCWGDGVAGDCEGGRKVSHKGHREHKGILPTDGTDGERVMA